MRCKTDGRDGYINTWDSAADCSVDAKACSSSPSHFLHLCVCLLFPGDVNKSTIYAQFL